MSTGCVLPVVAWPMGASGESIDVNITISGVTQTQTIATGSCWGWGVTSSSGAFASWSGGEALRQAILSHSSTALCAGRYDLITATGVSGAPATYILRPTLQVTLAFASAADAALFGWSSATVILAANTDNRSDWSIGGCWSPNGASGRVDVLRRQRAAASSSNMAAAFTDVVGWGEVSVVRLFVVQCKSAMAINDYAANPVYAAQAQRVETDPNNTLENLLAAVATQGVSQTLRISRDFDGTYLTAAMPAVATLPGALDHLSWTDEPRLLSGTVMFVGA